MNRYEQYLKQKGSLPRGPGAEMTLEEVKDGEKFKFNPKYHPTADKQVFRISKRPEFADGAYALAGERSLGREYGHAYVVLV